MILKKKQTKKDLKFQVKCQMSRKLPLGKEAKISYSPCTSKHIDYKEIHLKKKIYIYSDSLLHLLLERFNRKIGKKIIKFL